MNCRLQVRGVELMLGGSAVLRGVDLELGAGELVGLIGPNGSGKSSLMRVCAGLLPARAGDVFIDGIDLATASLAAKQRFGYAVEPERLPLSLRGRQCLELVARTRALDAAAVDESVALAAALGFAPWLDRPVADYSLGTRQKLSVLLALLGAPPLLLLDEVLNGLDPLAAYALKQELRRRSQSGSAVLLATHGLEVAERFLDRAVLLIDGRIAADWDSRALAGFRADPDGGLEHAVAERLRALPRSNA
jgi:ABC-2 type transport system ATP-binding protein